MDLKISRVRDFFGARGPRQGHKRIPRVRRSEKHRVSSKSGLWEGVSWPFFDFQVLFPKTKTFMFVSRSPPYFQHGLAQNKKQNNVLAAGRI